MSEKVMRRLAKPMLFTAAFIWGSSFFVMKDALDALPVKHCQQINIPLRRYLRYRYDVGGIENRTAQRQQIPYHYGSIIVSECGAGLV